MKVINAARHNDKASLCPQSTNEEPQLEDNIVTDCLFLYFFNRTDITRRKNKETEIAFIENI
ncbi:hypothetical protein GLUCORHAEAF1_01205 [Komagataeibacter rhaeticus AF1]|nr:hypothetical protein [Komagataeibacter rhaeticus]KDU97484.1 hypothetical protein GLUCORHAEAF1_01205 [Komagataeibacter rhaeticus AF1]